MNESPYQRTYGWKALAGVALVLTVALLPAAFAGAAEPGVHAPTGELVFEEVLTFHSQTDALEDPALVLGPAQQDVAGGGLEA